MKSFNNQDGGNNDSFDIDDYVADDDIPDYKLKVNNSSKDDKHEDIPFFSRNDFSRKIWWISWAYCNFRNTNTNWLNVIDDIDEEHLRRTPESMVNDIVFQSGIQTTDDEMYALFRSYRNLTPLV